MKTFFTFFTFFTLLSITINAQVFSENFNANALPTGWTVQNTASTFNWQVGTQSGFATFPNGAAFFDDDDAGPGGLNSNALITSPVIDISSVPSPKLSFKYANMIYDQNSIIKAEVFDGSEWKQVFVAAGELGTWGIDFDTFMYVLEGYAQSGEIDLTPYKNANFKLRFVYNDAGDYSYGGAVDDVIITDTPTLGVSDVSNSTFHVYPNPTTDHISIKTNGKISSLSITDISGKTVKVFSHEQDKYDVSDLPNGAYLIIIQAGKTTISKKIIKK